MDVINVFEFLSFDLFACWPQAYIRLSTVAFSNLMFSSFKSGSSSFLAVIGLLTYVFNMAAVTYFCSTYRYLVVFFVLR